MDASTHATDSGQRSLTSLYRDRIEWGNILGHQIPLLPHLDIYWGELASYFEWLDGRPLAELPAIEEIEVSDVSRQQPDFIASPTAWGSSIPTEMIWFSRANRLRNLLHYRPAKCYPGVRELEPYSFRCSPARHLPFYRRNNRRLPISTYRFDRVVDVQVTKNPLVANWRVEF